MQPRHTFVRICSALACVVYLGIIGCSSADDDLARFLDNWLPRFEAEGRSYVTICIGCTGGRHRSVYLAEQLADHFRQTHRQVLSYHRELE